MECPLCGATIEYYSDEHPQCPECKHAICDWMFEETREHRELLRSFWGHVIEENQGDIEKIRKCFRGGKGKEYT